jgi:hypothetical protein
VAYDRQLEVFGVQDDEKHKLDSDTVDLLVSTQCPVGPVGTKWEADPDWDWSWPENVQTFVTAQ